MQRKMLQLVSAVILFLNVFMYSTGNVKARGIKSNFLSAKFLKAKIKQNVIFNVKLSTFEINRLDNSVQIKWRTESEFQNMEWMIQRKEEGGTFKTIASIEGQLTKPISTDYEYVDHHVEIGQKYIYRLVDVSIKNDSIFHKEEKAIRIDNPIRFELSHNYPNPFNPDTQIGYTLPSNAKVTIKIFNILGQELKTLVDENQKAGFFKIYWNGKNENGIQMTSGIYVYQMTAKGENGRNFKQTRRMILSK